MAEIATQANPQRKAGTPSPSTVKLARTLPTGEDRLRLPDTTSTRFVDPITLLGAERADHARKLDQEIKNLQVSVNEKTHYLTSAQFNACADELQRINNEIAAAMKSGDADGYLRHLAALKAHFEIYARWIEYEQNQGLIGSCKEFEGRLYAVRKQVNGRNELQIYLCSADPEAFNWFTDNRPEAERRAALSDYVQGVQGIDVDVNRAMFQNHRKVGQITHLPCRIDPLVLSQPGEDGMFKVKTKVEQANGSVRYEVVAFSLEDVENGTMSVLQPNGALPPANTGFSRAGRDRESSTPPRLPVLVPPPRALPDRPPPAVPPAKPAVMSDAQKIIAERLALRDRLLSLSDGRPPAEQLTELSKSQADYDAAVRTEKARLIEEIKRAPGSSREYRAAADALRELELGRAWDLKLKAELLQLQLDDPLTKEAAGKELLRLADKADRAYVRLLSDPTSEGAAADLEARYKEFKNRITALEQSGRGKLGRLILYLKNAAGRTPGLTSLWSRLNANLRIPYAQRLPLIGSQWKLNRCLAVAEAIEKTLITTEPAKLDAKHTARQLVDLERQSNALKNQIKLHDERARLGNRPGGEAAKVLKRADNRATIRRGELLARQLAESPDAEKSLEIRRSLVRLRPAIEDALLFEAAEGRIDSKGSAALLDKIRDASGELEFADRLAAARAHGGKEFAATEKALANWEKLLKGHEPGTAEYAQAELARNAARSRVRAAVIGYELARWAEKALADPKNAAIQNELKNARRNLALEQKSCLDAEIAIRESQLKSVDARLADIETKLKASSMGSSERAALIGAQDDASKAKTALESEIIKLRRAGTAGNLLHAIGKVESDIKALEEGLTKSAESEKAALEKKIHHRKKGLLNLRQQLQEAKIVGMESLRSHHQAQLAAIEARLKSPAGGLTGYVEGEFDAHQKAELEKAIAANDKALELYKMGAEQLAAEKTFFLRAEEVRALKEDLAKTRAGGNPAAVSDLEAKLKDAEAKAAEAERAAQAKQASFNNEAKSWFRDAAKKWWQGIEMERPTVAFAKAGAFCGAYRAAVDTCYSDPTARVSLLPGMICLLDGGRGDGFFGWDEHMTVGELGVGGAIGTNVAVGGIDGGLNLLAFAGAIRGGQWLGGNTLGRVGALNTLGKAPLRLLSSGAGVGAFSVVDGYLTTRDCADWKYESDWETALRLSGPMATGAAFGSFFGPLGSATGAVGGGIGIRLGIWDAERSVAANADAELNHKLQKRGVYETFELALAGVRYPVGQETWPEPTTAQREALTELGWQSLAAEFNQTGYGFEYNKSDWRFIDDGNGNQFRFTAGDLSKMGFRPDGTQEAYQHNLRRIAELSETPAWTGTGTPEISFLGIGADRVVVSANAGQQLQWDHPELFYRFHELRDAHFKWCECLYWKAPKITYTNHANGGAAVKHSELGGYYRESEGKNWIYHGYIDKVAQNYRERLPEEIEKVRAEFAQASVHATEEKIECEAQWRVLRDQFRHFYRGDGYLYMLHRIMANPEARNEIFLRFKNTSGIDLEQKPFWTHKHLASAAAPYFALLPEEDSTAALAKMKQEAIADIERFGSEQ